MLLCLKPVAVDGRAIGRRRKSGRPVSPIVVLVPPVGSACAPPARRGLVLDSPALVISWTASSGVSRTLVLYDETVPPAPTASAKAAAEALSGISQIKTMSLSPKA